MDLIDEFYNGRHNEPDTSKRILFKIFNDLIQRVGFAGFWNSCTRDVKDEILRKNLEEIRQALN